MGVGIFRRLPKELAAVAAAEKSKTGTGSLVHATAPTLGAGVGIGASATIAALHAQQATGPSFTAIPANSAAIGHINSSTGWAGQGFVFSASANAAFSLVIGGDNKAYFGFVTDSVSYVMIQMDTGGIILSGTIRMSGLAGVGSRAVFADAAGNLSAP